MSFLRTFRNLFLKPFKWALFRMIASNPDIMRPKPKLNITGFFDHDDTLVLSEGCNIYCLQGGSLRMGQHVYIGRYAEIASTGKLLEIGDFTSVQDRSIILGEVRIGRYCVIAANVQISSGRHYFDWRPALNIKDQDFIVSSHEGLRAEHDKAIVIEDDCWIGVSVWIKAGITIGKGSVIGANSVVTKDVAPYSIVAGNPARTLRQRLIFAPPTEISAQNDADLPYFYSGCLTSLSERALQKTAHSIGVKNSFCLALSGGNLIELTLANNSGNRIMLRIGAQEKPADIGTNEIVFELAEIPGPFLNFTIGPIVHKSNSPFSPSEISIVKAKRL